jgi:hypothetical protein
LPLNVLSLQAQIEIVLLSSISKFVAGCQQRTCKKVFMKENPRIFLNPKWPVLLLPWPSGVIFEAQVNGMLCYQMSIEGICIPINQGYLLEAGIADLHPGCCVAIGREGEDPEVLYRTGLQEREALVLDALFHSCRVPIQVKREALATSCEAWVHITILTNNDGELKELGGRDAILTWQNCD